MSDSLLRDWCKGVLAGDDSFRFATGFDADVRLARAVATRLLELLPVADDGEFTTPEWLKSIGAVEVPREPFEYDLGPLRLSWWSGGERGEWEVTLGNSVFPHMNTRGHVRRLAAALGITLKEPK